MRGCVSLRTYLVYRAPRSENRVRVAALLPELLCGFPGRDVVFAGRLRRGGPGGTRLLGTSCLLFRDGLWVQFFAATRENCLKPF